MCIHKIIGKGGFNEYLFLPRHFEQTCVYGSLVGWIAPQVNTIDNLIGFDAKHISEQTNVDSLSEEVLAGLLDDTNCIKNNIVVVPAGYIPLTGVDMTPFNRNYDKNVV